MESFATTINGFYSLIYVATSSYLRYLRGTWLRFWNPRIKRAVADHLQPMFAYLFYLHTNIILLCIHFSNTFFHNHFLLLYNLHDCTFKFCICHKLKTIVPASAKIFITTLAVILTLNKEILKNISQEQQIVHNIAKTLNKCLRICQRILINFFQFHN